MMKITLMILILTSAVITKSEKFKYLTYAKIIDKLKTISKKYPEVVKLSDAYKKYSYTVEELKCGEETCVHPIIKMTNFNSNSQEIQSRPQVLFIGSMHGNEVIGTLSMVYMIEFLCKFKDSIFWDLLNSRLIVILPVANPWGYFNNKREEHLIDPNRDFPYDANKIKSCFQSNVARIINEVSLSHLFVSAITLHSGLNSISYSWGDCPHLKEKSPDHISLEKLTKRLKKTSDYNFKNKIRNYSIGTINQVCPCVQGPYEDYAYSGNWDQDNMKDCRPKEGVKFSDFRKNKHSLSSATFLLESGFTKFPDFEEYGEMNDWSPNGRINRNLLLSYDVIEFTAPSLVLKKIMKIRENDGGLKIVVNGQVKGCFNREKFEVGYQFHKKDEKIIFENSNELKSISISGEHHKEFSYRNLKVEKFSKYFSEKNKEGKDMQFSFTIPSKKDHKYMSMKITVSCDHNFNKEFKEEKKNPKTHFSIIRNPKKNQKKLYPIEHNGFVLNTYENVIVKVKGVKLMEGEASHLITVNKNTHYPVHKADFSLSIYSLGKKRKLLGVMKIVCFDNNSDFVKLELRHKKMMVESKIFEKEFNVGYFEKKMENYNFENLLENDIPDFDCKSEKKDRLLSSDSHIFFNVHKSNLFNFIGKTIQYQDKEFAIISRPKIDLKKYALNGYTEFSFSQNIKLELVFITDLKGYYKIEGYFPQKYFSKNDSVCIHGKNSKNSVCIELELFFFQKKFFSKKIGYFELSEPLTLSVNDREISQSYLFSIELNSVEKLQKKFKNSKKDLKKSIKTFTISMTAFILILIFMYFKKFKYKKSKIENYEILIEIK